MAARLQVNNLEDVRFSIYSMAAAIFWVRNETEFMLDKVTQVAEVNVVISLPAQQLLPKPIPFTHVARRRTLPCPFLTLPEKRQLSQWRLLRRHGPAAAEQVMQERSIAAIPAEQNT